jgi:ABC-2 type transport system ATP-binding protein
LLVEIEQICTHLAVMSQGKIVAQGSVADLSASETLNLKLVTLDSERALEGLESVGIKAQADAEVVTALVTMGQIEPERIVKVLVELGVRVKSFELAAPTLEERFVGLTGEGFDVAR